MGKKREYGIVIFVEGETDEAFYKGLVQYYRKQFEFSPNLKIVKYKNLQGVGKYKNAPSKFKNGIQPKYPNIKFDIICSYDTDIFEFKPKPPIQWGKVKQELKKYGAQKVIEIPVKRMIEDWFLLDVEGLCKYLKIDVPKNLKGKNGLEKIKNLFKKANKIYKKGYYSEKFIDYLDYNKITSSLSKELTPLVKLLKGE